MIYTWARAHHLAIFRIAVLGYWAIAIGSRPYADLVHLPVAWFEPHGPWTFVPDAVIASLWSPGAVRALQASTVAVLIVLGAGLKGRIVWSVLAVVMLTTLTAFERGFGHPDHADVQLLLVTVLLVFTPAWDTLAVHPRTRPREPVAYPAAFTALALVFSVPYLMTAAFRLAKEGATLYGGRSIQHFLVRDPLALDDFGFFYGLDIAAQPELLVLLNAGFVATTVVEFAAPWAHLSRRGCILWLVVILSFHVSTPFVMHILFLQNILLIVGLYGWPLLWPRTPLPPEHD